MKTAILLVLLLLASPVCLARQTWKQVGPPIIAALDVDAHGTVTHAQLIGKNVLPQLQTLTAQTTHNWRFEPATVDGKPASARTYAMFAVEMRKVEGSEQARLHYLGHGPGRVLIESPAYPPSMIQQRVEARILVAMDVNADGSVSNVHVAQARTTDAAKGAAFYAPSVTASRMDKFMPELVDGRPVITHVLLPIHFFLNFAYGPGDHLPLAEDTPHDTISNDKAGTTTFADVPIALDSPLRLLAIQP